MTDQVTPAATPAAPTTPAATPAAPAVPATPVTIPAAPVVTVAAVPTEPTTPAAEELVPVVYEKTGDVGLDYALNFVGNLGFGPEHPAVQAAMTGDFTLMQAQLATLGAKAAGYQDVVALAEQAYKNTVAKQQANEAALGQMAHQAAGGPERWAQVQAWASTNADPTEKQAINAALAAGGAQAKMALNYLVQCYNKSAGSTQEPASAVNPNASRASGNGNAPLTAKAYAEAVQELSRQAGGRDIADNPAYKALQAQRLAAKRAGY